MTARGREELIEQADATLLELVDHVLNRGVVVTGDVMLGIADVDLVYLRLSVLLCAADRLFPPEQTR
ncbi:MAG: gas vesicle protein [Acidobacteria bacterium]|nr:MAG: gas vesicle protein [Acidobacteriota bacterium]